MLCRAYFQNQPRKNRQNSSSITNTAISPPRKRRQTSSLTDTTVLSTKQENTWKSLCNRAEREFLKTEYEQALILYHRALKERPNCAAAKTGIRRCKESLNTILIEPIEKLSLSRSNSMVTPRASALSRQSSNIKPKASMYEWANNLVNKRKEEDPFEPTVDMRHDAIHTFTLRSNRTYMRAIYDHLAECVAMKEDTDIKRILLREMKYVKTRGYFWRSQIPIPTVPKLFKMKQPACVIEEDIAVSVGEEVSTREVTEKLNKVLQAHQHGRHMEAIQMGKECLELIDQISLLDFDYRDEILGTIYSIIGISYFEMEEIELSIQWHEKDLNFARKRYLAESESRALGNLGKSYAKAGDLEKAIALWTEKVPLCTEDSEKAWLYHEMGYCYLTIFDVSMAYQCGIMSYEAAEQANDYEWQQNSCLLIGQSSVAMGFTQNALETYNQALYLCDVTGDEEARENITMIMEQLRSHIELAEQGNATQEHEDIGPLKLPHRASIYSLDPVADNVSMSSSLFPRRQSSRSSLFKSAQFPKESSFVSKVSENSVTGQLTEPKRRATIKMDVKNATSSNLKKTNNKLSRSKTRVSFVLPATASMTSVRDTQLGAHEQNDPGIDESYKKEHSEPNVWILPNINDTAMVSQPVATTQTSTHEIKQSVDNGDLFDDENDKFEPVHSARSSSRQSVYLNTSTMPPGQGLRSSSVLSRTESQFSTDPRNALTDSDDVLSNVYRQYSGSLRRKSILSNS